MLEKLHRSLSPSLLLLLAFCAAVFIGEETVISIATLIVLSAELGISYGLFKKRDKSDLALIIALGTESLFLWTRAPWLLACSILLLIAASLWRAVIAPSARGKATVWRVARGTLFSLAALAVSVLWMVDLYAQSWTRPVKLPADMNAAIEDSILDSSAVMLRNIETMNAFGSRTTGSEGHNRFVVWLERQVTDMGFTVHRDNYAFDRWDEKSSSFFIEEDEIRISSVFPYSGVTDDEGVSGELVYTKRGDYTKASGKIAVVEIENIANLPMGLLMNVRGAFPEKTGLVTSDGDLVVTAALKEAHLEKAKEHGVLAVILVWKGASDDKLRKEYVPFTSDYAGIPAVWVNATEGQKVIRAARAHQAGTVRLQAELQKNAPTESFYVKIEGKNKQEAILVNTHTDGVNAIEENGAVGMLSMLRYLRHEPPERTMVFAFVTGHFRLPEFKGTSQATSTWLQAHPELWDGREGHMRAVAGITVEHLGSMEWKDDGEGRYGPTGLISTEYTYAGNERMGAIWLKAVEEKSRTRTVVLRGHNRFQFGESQPLFEAGIPVIGFIPMPDYLLVDRESREMDKFDVKLMREQIVSLLKAVKLVDATETDELGKSDSYSYFYGRTR
ncbi:Zn-dependent exopeptidase M28 [Cohnella terricola]|uniref:Zn-dependent exopeptidase M28 n=1 Tax=Cohnella terricola TaxID=1289167 RepID=A0A559IV80_9BACL|nr:Zn-dependent exopeptidase M28 [Cohnella terricola]TVX91530.1 Zn-dependent exopeptidase M28 [Cohnella terricola]